MEESVSDGMPAAEFAAFLRELKDRSGLSYGVLAKRLHMSTSTLHRYCNGDAVPTDYAPVERLARLCKARPEELVELHRRWVLADAVRGRKAGPAVPAPAVTQTPTPEALAPERPATEASATEVSATEVSATEVSATEVSGTEASEEDTEPGEEDLVADIGGPEGESSGEPHTAPRPRRRTRTAVLAGTAVAAVLVGVTLAVGLPGGGTGTGDDGHKGPTGSANVDGTEVTSSPSRSATSSPSASASASASASVPASPGAKGKHASSPPAAGPAAEEAASEDGGVPLTVQTDPYEWESPCSQRYLVNRPASAVKPPPNQPDATAWVSAFEAVSSGEQQVRLTVQGTGDETVVLEGISVRVAGKRSPLAWNDFLMGYPGVGCGGNVPTRTFSVALDAARPMVTPEAGHRDFPFSVSESDPEIYYINADASAYDVSWYLELKWSSGSRSGTLTVDDKGRPFRTSGNNGRPAYEFPLGGEEWVPEGTTT